MNYRSGASWTSASDMKLYQPPEEKKRNTAAPLLLGAAALGAGAFLLTRGKAGKEAIKGAAHLVEKDARAFEQQEIRSMADHVEQIHEQVKQAGKAATEHRQSTEVVEEALRQDAPKVSKIDDVLERKKQQVVVDGDYAPVVEQPKSWTASTQYEQPIGPHLPPKEAPKVTLYRGMKTEEMENLLEGKEASPVTWWTDNLDTARFFSRGRIAQMDVSLDEARKMGFVAHGTSDYEPYRGGFGVAAQKENDNWYSIGSDYMDQYGHGLKEFKDAIPEPHEVDWGQFKDDELYKFKRHVVIGNIVNEEAMERLYGDELKERLKDQGVFHIRQVEGQKYTHEIWMPSSKRKGQG